MDELKVELRADNGLCELYIAGEIDLSSAHLITETGVAGLDTGNSQLVVEMVDVTFIDSTGLGALVGLNEAAQNRGKQLLLGGLSPRVEQILTLSGLDQVFTRLA